MKIHHSSAGSADEGTRQKPSQSGQSQAPTPGAAARPAAAAAVQHAASA
jgi:hypothetical protein